VAPSFYKKCTVMKRIRLLFFLLTALLAVSCQEHFPIEDRARQQILVSMEDELESFSPGMSDWRIEDLKTVYVNDSICLLQCTARFHDVNGEKKVRDYRYIYLIDMMLKRLSGEVVFKEEFRNILCLPDELIKECRKEVARNGESVYDESFGRTLTVRKPFDRQ